MSLLILLPLSLLSQLAARPGANHGVPAVRFPHRPCDQQDRIAAAFRRAALFRPRRTRLRRARQCGAGAGLRSRRGGGARLAQPRRWASGRADAGAVMVGCGRGADPCLDHARHTGDLPGRGRIAFRRPGYDRRYRHVHEFRRRADRTTRQIRALRQPAVHGCPAASRVLRRTRYRIGGTRPARRGRSAARRGSRRVQERLVFL